MPTTATGDVSAGVFHVEVIVLLNVGGGLRAGGGAPASGCRSVSGLRRQRARRGVRDVVHVVTSPAWAAGSRPSVCRDSAATSGLPGSAAPATQREPSRADPLQRLAGVDRLIAAKVSASKRCRLFSWALSVQRRRRAGRSLGALGPGDELTEAEEHVLVAGQAPTRQASSTAASASQASAACRRRPCGCWACSACAWPRRVAVVARPGS
jgi:hypothetical protein